MIFTKRNLPTNCQKQNARNNLQEQFPNEIARTDCQKQFTGTISNEISITDCQKQFTGTIFKRNCQKENKNNGKKDKMTERIEGLIQGYYSRSQHHRSSMVAFRLFVKSVVRLPSSSRCCCCRSVQAVLGPFVLSHSRPSLLGLSFPKAVLCRVCVSVAVVQ